MKKILIIFISVFLLIGCNNFETERKIKIEKENYLNNKMLELKKKSDSNEEIINDVKIFSEINIDKINEEKLKEFIIDKKIVIDYMDVSDKKIILKVLGELEKISNKGMIETIDLRCQEASDIKLLTLLENMKIKKLVLNDACFFAKDNYKNNGGLFYDKDKVINFLKNTKYIEELDIGYIEYDKFKKENGRIKVYKNY